MTFQAELWYNKPINIVLPWRCYQHPRAWINLFRGSIMDSLYLHASKGNHNPVPPTSGIYKITCTITSKLYIGSALNLRRRKEEHFGLLHKNKHGNSHLQRAWNKYGEAAFIFEVIELVLPPFLLEREQHWLDKLHPFNEDGFNILSKAGSALGYKHTPEAIAKISKANVGRKASPETIEKLRQSHLGQPSHMKGKTTSLETREKLRQANLGKTYPPRSVKSNTYRVDGDACYIRLTQGKEAIISTSDLDRALKVRWRAQHDSRTGNYRANGMFQGEMVSLNRYLMEAKEGEWVDNLNGDTLDNRRFNLRLRDIPVSEQVYSSSKTGIRGVSLYSNNSNEMRYKFSCQCSACKITKVFPYTDEGLEAARIFAEAHYAAMKTIQ